MSHRRRLLLIPAAILFLIALFLVRPVWHLWRTDATDPSRAPATPAGHLDDASRLNAIPVAEVWELPFDHEDPEGQLAALLARARSEDLRVSIAGARHTMGGHTLYPGGIVVNMLSWNDMRLDESRDVLWVQAGALWSDILVYLDGLDRSVAVMQSNNSFSVGGSISANCHGWQCDRPPIASTVQSFRLMQADGSIVRCSRNDNAELFSLALGGYGLFGIILDVELTVVPNERYRIEQVVVPAGEALATFDQKFDGHPDLQLVYARLGIVPDQLFEEVILNGFFREPAGELPPIRAPGAIRLRRAVFRGSAASDYGKELRWSLETKVQPFLKDETVTRNQLFNESVEVFQNRTADTTDILHEYFVPRDQVEGFLNTAREHLVAHESNLLNVTVREVNEDPDTFLRYADQDVIAFVMLFVQETTDDGERRMRDLTRDLIDAALDHGGRHYLPYRLHATREQFHRAYPMARRFFQLKRQYDPDERFQNRFYEKYGR